MNRIKPQQMGVGLDRAEIVDADHLDILAAGLGDGPQHVAADAAKSVDRDPDCHSTSPQRFENPVFAAGVADFYRFLASLCPLPTILSNHHNPPTFHETTPHFSP